MDSIKGEKHISSSVQLLLNKLYDFVNNFPSTKLDVSLLEEINTTLHTIQIQLVINDDDDDVKDMLSLKLIICLTKSTPKRCAVKCKLSIKP